MTARPPFRITGKWVLKAFVIGLGIVVAVNGLLAYYAVESWSGLETEHAYDKGLAHNATLRDAREQARLGWRVDVAFETATAHGDARDGVLWVKVRDDQGLGVDGLQGTALFWRPTHEGSDQRESLTALGGGDYRADFKIPAAGQWDVRLDLRGRSKPYRLRRRILIK